MSADPIEVAWAAGIFEGEGYIGMGKDSRRTKTECIYRRLRMAMTDEDVVRRFHRVVDCGTVRVDQRNPKWKPIWIWDCARWPDIQTVLTAFLPHFGDRRSVRALELLANPAMTPGAFNSTKTHCPQGHPYDEANTYVLKGRRYCRACKRLKEQRRPPRRKTRERSSPVV